MINLCKAKWSSYRIEKYFCYASIKSCKNYENKEFVKTTPNISKYTEHKLSLLEKIKLKVDLVRDIDKRTNLLGHFIVSYHPGRLKMHFWFIWSYNYDKFSVICGTIFIKPEFFYLRKIWRQNEYQIWKNSKNYNIVFYNTLNPLTPVFAKICFI